MAEPSLNVSAKYLGECISCSVTLSKNYGLLRTLLKRKTYLYIAITFLVYGLQTSKGYIRVVSAHGNNDLMLVSFDSTVEASFIDHGESNENSFIQTKDATSMGSSATNVDRFHSLIKNVPESSSTPPKSLSGKKPFQPKKKYAFKNITIGFEDNTAVLYNKDGVIVGRFVYSEKESEIIKMVADLAKSDINECHMNWEPTDSSPNDGKLAFSCKGKIVSSAYTGELPITVKILGLSDKSEPKIYLSANGYTFKHQYDSLDSIKHAIMAALGTDQSHDCEIVKVNGTKYKTDNECYDAIMKLVTEGTKRLTIYMKPKIKLVMNIQEPFAKSSESVASTFGDVSIEEYKSLLKDNKKLNKEATEKLATDANGFTLVSVNDNYIEKNKSYRDLLKLPIDIDEKWTLMPDTTVKYHFLETFIDKEDFPIRTSIKEIIAKGQKILKKNVKGNHSFRLYEYSLPGCLHEEISHDEFLKEYGLNPLFKLPISESCSNTTSHIIDMFYFNEKIKEYSFDVAIENPDGSHIDPKKIKMKYVKESTIGDLKEAIINSFEEEGYLLSKECLEFKDISGSNGNPLTDKTRINSLQDINNEQKLGRVTQLKLKAKPTLKGIFVSLDGKEETLTIRLKTARPSIDDIKHCFEDELHNNNILKADEKLHGSIRLYPIDKDDQINRKIQLNVDGSGHLPPGTKIDSVAVVADTRVEIPVTFLGEDNETYNFKVRLPYGANNNMAEDLIKQEIEKSGYHGKLSNLSITINDSEDLDFEDIWKKDLYNKATLKVQPAKLVDVEGVIHNEPLKSSLKIHPHESIEEIDSSVVKTIKDSPDFDKWFKADPKHVDEISTLIMGDNGDAYSDDDVKNRLYQNADTVKIGVSDHPLNLVWMHPLTGEETIFCLSRKANGECRGASPKLLSKFSVQTIADFFISVMKRQDSKMYKEQVEGLVKQDKNLTTTVKLAKIGLIDGTIIDCKDVLPVDTIPIIEHTYGFDVSNVQSLIFTLMTTQEKNHIVEMARSSNRKMYRLHMSKKTGVPETHVISSDDVGPADLLGLIYKYFATVPFGSVISDMTVNGGKYNNEKISNIIGQQENGSNDTVMIEFGVHNDESLSTRITVTTDSKPTKIQPKSDETLRDFFERAYYEPDDYGLAPIHSYSVICLNKDGEHVNIEGLMDTPMKEIKDCKELSLQRMPTTRIEEPVKLTANTTTDTDKLKELLVLDNRKDTICDINGKLRSCLMNVPSDSMKRVTVIFNDKPIKCSLEGLKESYMVKYLTMDDLMAMCNIIPNKAEHSVVKLNINIPAEELSKSDTMKYLNRTNSGDSQDPIAYFSLNKGTIDVGLRSMVTINAGSLMSPIKEFHNKLITMFGESLLSIKIIRLNVVKNGRSYPCNNAGILVSLDDFKKVSLADIMAMCDIPNHVPESGTFYHFYVTMSFGDDMAFSSNVNI